MTGPLKENKKFADLEGEHCMQLCWKNFLKLYLASTTDGLKKREAWNLLKSCITRLLRKLSTRYKHQKLRMVCSVLEIHEERAQSGLILGPQKGNVIVPVKCATASLQTSSDNRERNKRKSNSTIKY